MTPRPSIVKPSPRRTGPLSILKRKSDAKIMIKSKPKIKPSRYPTTEKVFLPDQEASGALDHLLTEGYVVLNPEIDSVKSEILRDASQFPEYNVANPKVYVGGGFSALGNPSSFHCPSVRKLRVLAQKLISPILHPWARSRGQKVEQLFDRLVIRPKGTTISGESWHRDISQCSGVLPDDVIFGGWWNQDDVPNQFICVPRSHHGVERSEGPGFAKLSPKDSCHYNTKGIQVMVPAGHIILFNEMIVHNIARVNKSTIQHVRLFLGFRVTRSGESLCGTEEVVRRMKCQASMQVKSGQEPPMFPRLYLCNHVEKLTSFASTLVPSMKHEHSFGPKSKRAGQTVVIPRMFSKSLLEQGLPLYPVYSPEEIGFFIPN